MHTGDGPATGEGAATGVRPGGPPPRGLGGIAAALAEGRARSRVARFVRWAAVVVLLVLWLVFWIMPVVPGIQFLLLALFLMAPDFPPAHRIAARLQRKFPRARRTIPRLWRRIRRKGR